MRHWNSPKSNLLTDKNSEMNENKSGANTRYKVYALYKQICFRQQLTLILAVALSSSWAVFLLAYPLWLLLSLVRWNACSDERRSSYRIGSRSIVRSSGLSCDLIAISYNIRVHCTTVACRRKIYFASFNAFTLPKVALNRKSFAWVLYHMRLFWQQFTNLVR